MITNDQVVVSRFTGITYYFIELVGQYKEYYIILIICSAYFK